MGDNSKKPGIRFKGFTDDWEQRKLGDVAEFSKGSGYSKGDLVEYGTPIILYGRLYTNYETRISDVDTFVEAKVGSVYSKGRRSLSFQRQVKQQKTLQGLQPLINQGFCLVEI